MTEIELSQSRCGFIALVGAPNAGKSTLLNALVGAKVSIVTHKAQTTRAQIRGVVTEEDAQVIFVDTPGVFSPKRRLDRAMVHSAWAGAGDADQVALIVDAARGISPDVEAILDGLQKVKQTVVLVLNKTDKLQGEKLLKLSEELNSRVKFEQTFMVSALTGSGVKDFMRWAVRAVPFGPFHFPDDQITDLTLAITSAEVTREKLFNRIHEEIPYNTTVEVESFKVQRNGSYRIEQVIYVTRDTHKKILLGTKGQTIKAIGAESRQELKQMFETDVHLFLFVKVRAKWADDPERYENMGLDFSK